MLSEQNFIAERLRTPASPMGVSIKSKIIQMEKDCTCPQTLSSWLLLPCNYTQFGQEFFSYFPLKSMPSQCIVSWQVSLRRYFLLYILASSFGDLVSLNPSDFCDPHYPLKEFCSWICRSKLFTLFFSQSVTGKKFLGYTFPTFLAYTKKILTNWSLHNAHVNVTKYHEICRIFPSTSHIF